MEYSEKVNCTVTAKIQENDHKPTKSYIDITFEKSDQSFSYIVFQNFYTHSITIKSLKDGKSPEDEDAWEKIYTQKLMESAHFEGDAMNWHFIMASKFSGAYNKKQLRIFLKSPSPSWVDFYIKNVEVYQKKFVVSSSYTKPVQQKLSPFQKMKKEVRKLNKKKQKKVGESEDQSRPTYEENISPNDEISKIDFAYTF